MRDMLLLYGNHTLYLPDAVADFSASTSAEAGLADSVMNAMTGYLYPFGNAGEGVFRRLYVKVEHQVGISLLLTPWVDGVRYSEATTFVSRPSGAERHTFIVPLFHAGPTGERVSGIRGAGIAVEVEARNPVGRWSVEDFAVATQPIRDAAGIESPVAVRAQ